MTVQVSLVPPDGVVPLWPKVRPHMAKAAEYTFGRFQTEDILVSIVDSNFMLWIAYDDSDHEVIGAVVTSIENYPRMRCLCMHFCGGDRLADWKDPMLALLRAWAKDTGCDRIESSGRPGWAKIFSNDGHTALWHTYELPIEAAGGDDG